MNSILSFTTKFNKLFDIDYKGQFNIKYSSPILAWKLGNLVRFDLYFEQL